MKLAAAALLASALLASASCVTDTHPLASDGALKFLADDAALFAADILNGAGVPVTPRQLPFEKSIGLYLSVGAAPDRGAYVDLIVEPPGAVRLLASDDGTCVALPGAFRCTAGADGFASFFARSESGYSGTLAIQVVGRTEEQPLTIRPAGIPDGTSDFVLLVSGIAGNRVPAKYNRLECTLAPMPDQSFDKWPAGAIRVREAQIRATPPTFSPASLEHAPVLIESLHPEAFVSLEPDCLPPHASRLRVQLDAVGQSPPFFFCFSDLGGNVPVAYASGDTKGDSLTLSVDPEPRLLRVVTADATLSLDPLVLVKVLELSAFDSDLNQLALKVDVTSSDPEVFSLVDATVKLPGADEGDVPLSVFGRALAAGKVTLSVSPALYITPSCASLPIVVEP